MLTERESRLVEELSAISHLQVQAALVRFLREVAAPETKAAEEGPPSWEPEIGDRVIVSKKYSVPFEATVEAINSTVGGTPYAVLRLPSGGEVPCELRWIFPYKGSPIAPV